MSNKMISFEWDEHPEPKFKYNPVKIKFKKVINKDNLREVQKQILIDAGFGKKWTEMFLREYYKEIK